MRCTLNISMPKVLKDWIDQQVKEGGYGTASEYVRELVRDKRLETGARLNSKRGVRENLLNSLDSGPLTPLRKSDLDRIRARGLKRLKAERSRK